MRKSLPFWDYLKNFCVSVALFYFLAFCFGAPLFSSGSLFFASFQTLFTFQLLSISCPEPEQFWQSAENRPQTLQQLYAARIAAGSVIGGRSGRFHLFWALYFAFGWLHFLRVFVSSLTLLLLGRWKRNCQRVLDAEIPEIPSITSTNISEKTIDSMNGVDHQPQSVNHQQTENGVDEHPASYRSVRRRHFFDQEPPKLRAIIYAEFDNDIGRVVRFQVPDEIFDKQRFDTISSAIIPSEEMRDRMIKINMYDYKITGHPVGIKDKKYPREVYIFNMCFVVDSTETNDDDSIYEPLVQKCAEYLVELEKVIFKERCFLSEEKHRMPILMREIFDELNHKGECVCRVTDQTTLYLRLCPAFLGREPPPHPLSPFLVPIFTRFPPPISREALNRMDVLSQKICPQIDGVRCIKDIACAVQIDNDLVGRCIRNLCFHGCLALLPQFLYSNFYVPTERLRHFFDSPQIVEQCLKFVALLRSPQVQLSDMARLYLALKPGSPLTDWLMRMRPRQLNVDERKLIQFGVYFGFVRKQLIYPVAIQQDDGTKIGALCDGEHSLDALALHYSCSPVELQRRLAENGNFRFIAR